ncbi:SDR family oxidoreductase [Sphingomonas colocasiae]|uniref:NAD(P)-dependent oxidoreductase n=1 Tax=Sphingomonas colocasiae TaxID=1848973 RepID=A0ABS7PYC1_9SPHN|nr:NAD(P)-dependent oxidoreductase [Sphingomonas colocasiae]MBY8825645.1 NAD(P)-dependent oxidoreductase [Sphingomonas colocasiae]
MADLCGKTLFITGASRGIGLAIALRAAREGANIVIAAKSSVPRPGISGTIFTAADAIERAGGKALPIAVDIRDGDAIDAAVEKAVAHFGGVDICVNNASAINLGGTLAVNAKSHDLMHQINARGTYLVSRACLPHLLRSANPHVLALSPPPHMRPHWFGRFPAYALSKFGMSIYMMAMAEEFRAQGVAFNGLWPRTAIATAALGMGGEQSAGIVARRPEIMAEAACTIFKRDARACTGRFFLDDEVLWEAGHRDFDAYQDVPGMPLTLDLFVDRDAWTPPGVAIA